MKWLIYFLTIVVLSPALAGATAGHSPDPTHPYLIADTDADDEGGYDPCEEGPSDSQMVCRGINTARRGQGLDELLLIDKLNQMALDYAKVLYAYNRGAGLTLSHEIQEKFSVRIASYGVTSKQVGENLAAGDLNTVTVVSEWLASPGHRENIMLRDYTMTGIAHYGHFWVQIFAN